MIASCRDPTPIDCSYRQPPNTCHNRSSEGAPTPPHIEIDANGSVNDILLHLCSPPPASSERVMDPMLFEALLIGQRSDTERGTSTPSCNASQDSSAGEIHSPILLRSEAEQLVGQELIKALSDFKQLETAPSTPQIPGRAKWASMRHTKFGPAQARHDRRAMGCAWHDTSQQAVLGPHSSPLGGTARHVKQVAHCGTTDGMAH
jgi:hypothetical protein